MPKRYNNQPIKGCLYAAATCTIALTVCLPRFRSAVVVGTVVCRDMLLRTATLDAFCRRRYRQTCRQAFNQKVHLAGRGEK